MSTIDWIARVLLIIGGLNWGLVGVFRANLVSSIFGEATMASNIVYGLVGIAALYEIIRLFSRESLGEKR
jgi:uncharacterized membrane protein YuzA (DUF378 family)